MLGELPEHSVVRTLQDLHFDLLAGRTGRVVNGVGGFCLLLLCLTGLVIWWPGRSNWRSGFTIDWARPWKRTGARLAEPPSRGRSVGDAIMAWVAPLHVGNFGGIGVRLVWFVTGLAPVWLGGSGLVLWWTRVVTPWRARSRRPPSVSRP